MKEKTNSSVEQNRESEIDPLLTDTVNLSLTKEERQNNGKKTAFSTYGSGTTGHPHSKNEFSTDLTLFTNINSKQITVLNLTIADHKLQSIKLLKNNTGENINDLEYDDDFLDKM